ncbi:hypothetical protein GCM10010191_36990 [Actinomadura vinacea]|uniref:Lipoprotein n=1 Tax=Actinomadura vinacea TaxID=115336 RepID=A0ABN3J449_9ACTN
MSGRTIKAVAAAAVAAAALAGCGGGEMKVGSAALVGDERIAVSTLNGAVSDWQREFRADPMANRMRADPGSFGQGGTAEPLSETDLRRALDLLVRFRIADEVARRQNLPVSAGRVDQIVDDMNQSGGAASTVRAVGLPARYTRDVARLVAVELDLGKRFGGTDDPRSPQSMAAEARVDAVLTGTAGKMKIKINPRFGSFDPNRVSISPVTARLSAPESGTR